MMFVPRIECQCDLLPQTCRTFTTDRFIKHIEIFFRHDFICFFDPHPTQDTNRNSDGCDLQGIVQSTEQDLLTSRKIRCFQRGQCEGPQMICTKTMDRPFQIRPTGILQCPEGLPDDQSIRFLVSLHVVDDPKCCGLAFLACTTSLDDPISSTKVPKCLVTTTNDVRKIIILSLHKHLPDNVYKQGTCACSTDQVSDVLACICTTQRHIWKSFHRSVHIRPAVVARFCALPSCVSDMHDFASMLS